MAPERGAAVAVGEAEPRVLPAHEGDEELGIGAGHGIEGLDGSAARRVLARGDGGQTAEPGRGGVHLGQRVRRSPSGRARVKLIR